MGITKRSYRWPEDYDRVGAFLKANLGDRYESPNWTQARWEYMHYHPYLNRSQLNRIGIWEDEGEIIAVIHFELALGEVYVQVRPGYEYLKKEMVQYAEEHLYKEEESGGRLLRIYINGFDQQFKDVVSSMGYTLMNASAEQMSVFDIPTPFVDIPLPEGYYIKGLDEENDLLKLDRLIWRGFNHEGEPPEDNLEGRKLIQSAPNYDKALNLVVHSPDGDYCAYSGIWYDDVNKLAYVEPVCTDPSYRRMGLGRAAVLECIRRCAEMGATIAKVGTNMPFYLSFGFREVFRRELWKKSW